MKGQKLGRYTLIRRVGAGGMAEVWKARFTGPAGFEKAVAIKKVLNHLGTDNSFVEMFVAEAKLIARLTHPNIVQLVDFARAESEEGNEGPAYFIAMEYVAGQHLGAILRRTAEGSLQIPLEVALFITAECARALDYAHSEGASTGRPAAIVHQDISPANIIISYDGEVKVTDFGIANVVRALLPQEPGRVTGKAGYMSPEQARGKPLDARSDIFSLGIVLAELVTARRLFPGNTIPEILNRIIEFEFPEEAFEHVPYQVQDILRKALAINKEDRYEDAAEMEADLTQLLDRGTHISARKALASLVQSLFKEEYQREIDEEQSDPDEPTTAQAEVPAPDTEGTRSTLVVSEIQAPGLASEVSVSASEVSVSDSASDAAPTAVSDAGAAQERATPTSAEPTHIVERDVSHRSVGSLPPGQGALQEETGVTMPSHPGVPSAADPEPPAGDDEGSADPPTIPPSREAAVARPQSPAGRPATELPVREEDPTEVGPPGGSHPGHLPQGTGSDDATEPRHALSNSGDPTAVGPPPGISTTGDTQGTGSTDRDTPLSGRPSRHGVVDYPDHKTVDYPSQKGGGGGSLRWVLAVLFGVVMVSIGFLVTIGMQDNDDVAGQTATPTADTTRTDGNDDVPLYTWTEPPATVAGASPTPDTTPTAETTARETPEPTARAATTPPATRVIQRTPTPPARTPTPTPTPRPAASYGYLTVNARPWVNVYVNGELVSREAVQRVRIRSGSYKMEFVNQTAGFRARQVVEIRPNRETNIFVDVKTGRIRKTFK